ncbi:MAG: hypothetical protein IPI57_20590 [Candidatus Competibacteraceae bacterium]|nr:hypothetical protein [Candidatus Competibacteraceae bacterium]
MPWALRATPVSDLQTALGVLIKYPDVLQQIQILLPDVAVKTQDTSMAQAAIEKAELIIKDWLKESDWAGVVRRQLVEAGIVGTGVIKGPFPKERPISVDVSKILDVLPLVTDALTAEMLTKELEVMLFYTPQIECTKVENCYPDADCGCDVQNGKFFWEKIPNVTACQLKDLCKDPSYDVATIKQALEEGPQDEESL